MKLDGGWMWCVLFLFSLAVAAQDEQLDVDVSDTEDMDLDEEQVDFLMSERDEEDAIVMDEEHSDETDTEAGMDADVSFQVTYKTPVPTGDVYFAETFDHGSLDRWQLSKTLNGDADDDMAKYDGKWAVEHLKENKVPGDQGLVLKSRAKHHAISAMLDKPFVFLEEPLVVQYEVNFQEGVDCGGAYLKLLSDTDNFNLEQFHDRTPYTIMFGPDKCGEDYKLHFIFRHQNPLNKDWEEKHAKRPSVDLKTFYTDKKTHLYTLVLNPDNSYEIFIDQSRVSHGNLLLDVVPPVNPPKEVDDPNDSKPDDWDERAKIPDPEAVKPDDWDEDAPAKIDDPDALKPEGWLDDEAEFIPDPNFDKPEDWDEEMDGEWEAPQIPNPACATALGCAEWKHPQINNPQYKGKWKAPLVDNPIYQGVWKPRKISNPEYFEDLQPFRMAPFKALGLELWSMTSDIYFDNFIITPHKEVADRWASGSWGLKNLVASANEPGIFAQLMIAADERPWLWVIFILTVGLPVGLIVLFCWPKKSGDSYMHKKVDPPPFDVDVDEEEEEEEEDDNDEVEAAEVEEDNEEVEAAEVEEDNEEVEAAEVEEDNEEVEAAEVEEDNEAKVSEGAAAAEEEEEEDGADGRGDNLYVEESKEKRPSEDEAPRNTGPQPKEGGDVAKEGGDVAEKGGDVAEQSPKQAVRKRRVRKD